MKLAGVPASLIIEAGWPVMDGGELTVTSTTLELAVEQSPLCTTARKLLVTVRLPVLKGLAVELMNTQSVPLVEDSHRTMEPVWPLRLIVVEEPLQRVSDAAVAVSPTLTGLTVTVAAPESTSVQSPLRTIARNSVVAVRLPVLSGLLVEAMGDQAFPSGEDSHLTMEPVWPLRLIVVPEPLQTVAAVAVTVPPTVGGFTVTYTSMDGASAHTPLRTTARKCFVAVRFPVLSRFAVELMEDHSVPLSEDSQRTMEPVWPARVIMVEEPLQTADAVAVAVPPTLAGLTVTVDALESTTAHPPLWTIGRNSVVTVRGPVSNVLAVDAWGDQVLPSRDDSHHTTEPVWPVRMIVVEEPLQMVPAVGVVVPPTEAGLTVTTAGSEVAWEHNPLCTTARKCLVAVGLPVFSGLAVEILVVQVIPSGETSHLKMEPVWLPRVIRVEEPLHTADAVGVAVPPALAG